jgi:CheY-like chemotaxis protein
MNTLVTTVTNDGKTNGTHGGEADVRKTAFQNRGRILVVDADQAFRESLVQELAIDGYEVLSAETGRRAFSLLRDWRNPIGWLYTRAGLDSLIDGRVLADEYHSTHPERPAIIAASETGPSASGDIVLKDPTPSAVAEVIRGTVGARPSGVLTKPGERADAA